MLAYGRDLTNVLSCFSIPQSRRLLSESVLPSVNEQLTKNNLQSITTTLIYEDQLDKMDSNGNIFLPGAGKI